MGCILHTYQQPATLACVLIGSLPETSGTWDHVLNQLSHTGPGEDAVILTNVELFYTVC